MTTRRRHWVDLELAEGTSSHIVKILKRERGSFGPRPQSGDFDESPLMPTVSSPYDSLARIRRFVDH